MKRRLNIEMLVAAAVAAFSMSVQAMDDVDLTKLPPAVTRPIDFVTDVRPIFESTCFKCHSGERPKGHFVLDNRAAALKGGDENKDDILPGDSAHSKLIIYVAQLFPDMEMPPIGKSEPLTPEQIGVLRAWIDQGAAWGSNAMLALEFSVTPTMRWMSVSGDGGKFREIEGVKEGWGAGLQDFSMVEPLSPETTFTVDGHALWPDEDYKVQLGLRKREFGFVRGGFEIWRKYYDDNGIFAPTFPTNFYRLDRDLHLDIGRAWIDFGLTLPNRPQIVLGYEYQFRNGNESTLQLGPVGTLSSYDPASDVKRIYPAAKHIDESVHILKADLAYQWGGWELADSARVEFYKLRTHRSDVVLDTFGTVPDTVARVKEHTEHTQGMNTLSASKQVKDWWFVSGAYYYSRMEGTASLQQNTLDGMRTFIDGPQWSANDIFFERETHSGSIANLLGPWDGLTLSVGAQGEWTHQRSLGSEDLATGNPATPPLSSDPSLILGKLDSTSVRENVGLRYTKIPFTVLFAEANLRQECLGRFEERPETTVAFLRDTEANISRQEYRVGFNSSPWSRVSFNASYRHSLEETDYNHLDVFSAAGYSYPGFILWRDITDDQVDARLVWRVNPWLRTSLNYRFQQTQFDDSTMGVLFVTPGGDVNSAREVAHVISASATLTPIRKLYLSATISYSDSRIDTFQNGADYVTPYDGYVISAMSTATYSINPKTSLRLSYNFSRSDYGQENKSSGLPLGIEYERHALQAGLSRQLTKNVSGTLTYAFSQYQEPTAAGHNDYTAHGVFAALTYAWQ